MEFGFLVALVIALAVLGRDDDRGRLDRLAVLEAQGDLALGVGLKERRGARMAVGGHLLQDLVAVIERRRHQVGGFVAGEAEHDALVAGAFILVAAGVDALRDVRRLRVEVVGEVERLPVEAVLLIADALTVSRTVCSISPRTPGAQIAWPSSMMPLPRISPARTTSWVVVIVSQATRASGSFDRNRSTIASEIWSATLSGWPSETDSDVKRYELRMGEGGSLAEICEKQDIKDSLYRPVASAAVQRNRGDEQHEAKHQRDHVAEAGRRGSGPRLVAGRR